MEYRHTLENKIVPNDKMNQCIFEAFSADNEKMMQSTIHQLKLTLFLMSGLHPANKRIRHVSL